MAFNIRTSLAAMLSLVSLLMVLPTGAGETDTCGSPGRCAICGQPGPCQQKVCRVECGKEKIKKHYWCVEVNDVCNLRPSLPCKHGEGCCDCQASGDCVSDCETVACGPQPSAGLLGRLFDLGRLPSPVVPPQPGKTRTVKKLVKKEYEVEVPVYKAVVRYVCAECLAAQACGVCAPQPSETPQAAPTPAAPSPAEAKPEAPAIIRESPSADAKPIPERAMPVMFAPLPPT